MDGGHEAQTRGCDCEICPRHREDAGVPRRQRLHTSLLTNTHNPSNNINAMKRLLLSLAWAAFVVIGTPSHATLLLYDPFNYTAGERLGGSGTSPLGQIAPNGQQWITRSPALAGSYVPANDTLITAGNLSYAGLVPSLGNSVRYGTSANNGAGLYTDAIALPSAVTSGSLYYSMIVRLNGVVNGSTRTSWASLSTESANAATDAGVILGSASGSAVDLPAGAWIRNSATVNFHLGGGKIATDGLGTSASAPSWQAATAYPNQQGNTTGLGQDYATIADDIYFIVMKYTFFDGVNANNNLDTVSLWINPIASTLGDNAGEAVAGAASGSYYSAISAFVTTANSDADHIQSFLLIGQAVAQAASARSIDTSLDELRIGTTWADVTPVPEPGVLTLLGLGLTGLLCSRRRN
jgi:hypothetical protein